MAPNPPTSNHPAPSSPRRSSTLLRPKKSAQRHSNSNSQRQLKYRPNEMESIVSHAEFRLRVAVIASLLVCLGTMMPQLAPAAWRLLEMTLAGWITCRTILEIAARRAEVPTKPDTPNISTTETISPQRIPEEIETVDKSTYDSSSFMPKQLCALEHLYIMLVGTHQRISPNGKPTPVDNDIFHGRMLLMFRTPDVDDPTIQDPMVRYFRGKQRRFEFQWQLKLKKIPTGEVLLGCEMEEPIRMGMIQRALVNTALKFVKKVNVGFGYELSDSSECPSFLSFPLGTSMDRFVATRPGEAVPLLGQEIYEDPDVLKKRKRGAKIEWNTDDVYTMSLWSAYFDWIDWQILNFPGIRPFSATSVAGIQPIKLTVYMVDHDEGKEKSKQREVALCLEVSNSEKAALGTEAKAWKMSRANSLSKSKTRILEYALNGNENYADFDEENSEEDDDEPLVDGMMHGLEPECCVISGSLLSLREGTGSFVASGGGYAVLQRSTTSAVVLEKVRSKKSFLHKSEASGSQFVIRNGDTVRVKLVNLSTNVTKYLCIYRGWWLRWTSNRLTKTGSFRVRTAEPSAALLYDEPFSLESKKWSHYHVGVCFESSVKFGGRMLAIYKAGKLASDEEPPLECDYDDLIGDDDKDLVVEKPVNRNNIMPLLLCAVSMETSDAESSSPTHKTQMESHHDKAKLNSESSDCGRISRYELDVPICLEVMNRNSRTTQLVYAVRVKEIVSIQNDENTLESVCVPCPPPEQSETGAHPADSSSKSCQTDNFSFKLRTGLDLAPILSLSISHKDDISTTDHILHMTNLEDDCRETNPPSCDFSDKDPLHTIVYSSSSEDSNSDDEVAYEEPSDFLIAGPCSPDKDNNILPERDDFGAVFPEEEDAEPTDAQVHTKLFSGEEVKFLDAIDKAQGKKSHIICQSNIPSTINPSLDVMSTSEHPTSSSSKSHEGNAINDFRIDESTEAARDGETSEGPIKKKNRTKHSAVFNRVAKTLKSSTVITGKHMIKQSKKVGKVTYSAAGAIPVSSVVYPKPPRKHEPGGVFSGPKGATKNSMKLIGRAIKNMEGQFVTGINSEQLLPPDQSKTKISQILSQLSTNESVSEAISVFVRTNSAQDLAFLRGCSAELGVVPLKSMDSHIGFECICARGIWEGRWREELVVLYTRGNHLAFYRPLSRKPSLVVGFEEIISIRRCDPEPESSPLPGLPLIAIDTAWKCHYLAFLKESDCDNFIQKTNDAIYRTETENPLAGKVAPEWESFKMSLETSLTGNVGKWATVSVGKKSKQKRERLIFNGRRMTFDVDPIVMKGDCDRESILACIATYAEGLLRKALSLSPEALESNESSFTEFLDEVSRLRSLPLHEIDYNSKEALCTFVNVYHCLLQHALLYAVDGLPEKRSVTRFKRCSSYEIGGDVFSLSELECCVIRGKMSKAVNVKPPFVEAAKKSRSHLQYALDAVDNRINFFLNNGSVDYPSEVPVLQTKTFEIQIQNDQVKINGPKRVVFLPKVCDVYRNDFGMGDGLICLSQVLRFLDEADQLIIAALLEDGGQIAVKFKPSSEKFHSNLTEKHDDQFSSDT